MYFYVDFHVCLEKLMKYALCYCGAFVTAQGKSTYIFVHFSGTNSISDVLVSKK